MTNGHEDLDNAARQHGLAPTSERPVTTEQLVRTVQAERDYVDGQVGVLEERLGGMDTATRLLSETLNRVPTEVQKEVGHLHGVMDVELESIAKQFAERDTRSEREARDNKLAVDAAFAAQEKQAVAQNDANTTAINKSEQATTETTNKLAELFETRTSALKDQHDDLKQRVQAVESNKQGGSEVRQEAHVTSSLSAQWIGVMVSIVVAAAMIAGAVLAAH